MDRRMFPLVLLVAGIITHLWWWSYPPEVIFDEVHFGKFVTAYCCSGSHFFDIHPPHAKLLIAGTAYLLGYHGGFSFETIGQPYGATPVTALRALPLLTGILLPVAFYWLLRELDVSFPWSFVGALAVALDNGVIIQTRIIALDGFLLLASVVALAALLAARRSRAVAAWWWSVASGVAAGAAVGTKFTGLAIMVLIGAFFLAMLWQNRRSLPAVGLLIGQAVVITFVAGSVYLGGWVLHFALLPNPGTGDVWMIPEWKTPLVKSFFAQTTQLHRLMLSANYNLKASHPDQSAWWTWPVMYNPVYYWTGQNDAALYFIGNPVVWWGASLLMIGAGVSYAYAVWRHRLAAVARWAHPAHWLPLLGFALALAPLTRIPRALFLYHYLTPLLFSIIITVVWLDRQSHNRTLRQYGPLVAAGLLLIGFFFLSPVTYGYLAPWQFILHRFFLR